ncbi:MAG: transglycosylase domain-containing protein [Caldilineaceae bacterium]
MKLQPRPHRCFLLGFFTAILLISGCSSKAQIMVGDRPASRLPAVVESYLQKYQPGPLPRLFQTTYLYDRNGIQLAELFEEGRRTWVGLNRISPHLVNATIATEDDSFYSNMGIDPLRIAAAAWRNQQEGRILSGASTITMQLARNLFLGPEERTDPTVDRKLLEVGLAQELTSSYTKAEILEMYLNLLNYGNLAYGPEAAAQTYFNKSAAELDLAEASLLAGLPQSPGVLNPFRNFAAVKDRQRVVLNLMVRHGYLTQYEADWTYRQPVKLRADISPAPMRAPHFVQYVIQSIDERMGEGYTRRSGFNLFTTLDLRMQELAEKIIREQIAKLQPKHDLGNAALVAMRAGSGEVLALVGSADFANEEIDGQVNMALSPRQPGSTIKPILFATAFNDNLISPASILWDVPVTYDLGANQYYRPLNYDLKFHGLVTARSALANSYNVPVVRLLAELGIEHTLQSANAMGLHSLQRGTWYGLGLALGSNEVSLIDMVTAYHTIANGGAYRPPEVASTILDSQSQLIKPLPPIEPVQVISPAAAFLTTDILSDNNARTPMFGANSPLRLSRPAAAKTGTTTDFRDNWTLGFTRQLVVGVWAGNADGKVMRDVTGVTGAAPIWHDFMEAVIADPVLAQGLTAPNPKDEETVDEPAEVTDWSFHPPADVVLLAECPLRLSCRRDGSEYFSQEWLALAGDGGPLADSFDRQPVIPVQTNRYGGYWPIFCSSTKGEVRNVLRLSNRLGLPGVRRPSADAASVETADSVEGKTLPLINSLSAVRTADNHYVVTFYPENELERLRRLRWARHYGLAASVGPCDTLQFYAVQPGDYWTKLASRYSVTLLELQAANPHAVREGGVLLVGDRLLVPTGINLEIGDRGRFYTVQDGDSWMKIATQFDLPLKLLQLINPDMMRPNFILQPGDELFIPAGVPAIQ